MKRFGIAWFCGFALSIPIVWMVGMAWAWSIGNPEMPTPQGLLLMAVMFGITIVLGLALAPLLLWIDRKIFP